jgi:hypothetical protein
MVGGIEGVWKGLESRDSLSVYIVWPLLAWKISNSGKSDLFLTLGVTLSRCRSWRSFVQLSHVELTEKREDLVLRSILNFNPHPPPLVRHHHLLVHQATPEPRTSPPQFPLILDHPVHIIDRCLNTPVHKEAELLLQGRC